MLSYIVRHSLFAVLALLFVIVGVFVATHLLGDPTALIAPIGSSPEYIDYLRHELGLDLPLHMQFWDYLKSIANLDFGLSYWYRVPCLDIVVFESLPKTVQLATAGIVWAAILGVVLGLAAGVRPGSKLEKAIDIVTMSGVSAVDFWTALMLIMLFGLMLDWLPTSGYGSFKHLILPALALGFRTMGRIAQLARPAVTDELNKVYVLRLRASGLPGKVILFKHLLRNAGVTIMTLTAMEYARMYAGLTAAIEILFGWPGLGRTLILALQHRDYPMTITCAIVGGTIVIGVHLFTDLVYGWIDPRIRYS